jgi:hypothetical protein
VERGTAAWRVQASDDRAFSLRQALLVSFHIIILQYSYLGSTPLFIVFAVGVTTLKFKEGACPVAQSVFLVHFRINDTGASCRAGFVLSENESELIILALLCLK